MVTDSIGKYDIIGHKTRAKSRQIENVFEGFNNSYNNNNNAHIYTG